MMLTRLQVPVAGDGDHAKCRAAGRWDATTKPGALLRSFQVRVSYFSTTSTAASTLDEGGVPPAIAAIQSLPTDLPAEGSPAAQSPASHGLSAREVEVLRLLAMGKSNAQIAEALVISPNTVNRHVSNIYAKTGAANRAEAASTRRATGSSDGRATCPVCDDQRWLQHRVLDCGRGYNRRLSPAGAKPHSIGVDAGWPHKRLAAAAGFALSASATR